MSTQEEIQLVRMAQENPDLYDAVLKYYSPLLAKYANRIVHDWAIAEEIAHRELIKLFIDLQEVKPKYFKSSVFERVRSRSIDHVRRSKIHAKYLTTSEAPIPSRIDDKLAINDDVRHLYECIHQLPHKYKEVIYHYLEGLHYREIGKVLDVSFVTAHKYTKKAFNLLKDCLKKKDIIG